MKVFLASSCELNHEREYLASVVFYLGRLLHDMGLEQRVELVKWEYLDSSMGMEHKQTEYNHELAACDATVVLFWRKFGEYTASELQTALQGVRTGGSIRRLVVLFKDAGEPIPSELMDCRLSLSAERGIMTESFSSDDELRAKFLSVVFAMLAEDDPSFNVPPHHTLAKYGLA